MDGEKQPQDSTEAEDVKLESLRDELFLLLIRQALWTAAASSFALWPKISALPKMNACIVCEAWRLKCLIPCMLCESELCSRDIDSF